MTCLAPWDTVLTDADNFPGGEPVPDGEEIAIRCRAAGNLRVGEAVASGSMAVALVGLWSMLDRRRSRVGAGG